MDSTLLNDLRERIADANRQLAGRNFQIMFNPWEPNIPYVVDLSNQASSNVISGCTINRFVAGVSYWNLEAYYVGDVAADEYSVDPGYYLAISFYL